MESKYQKLSSGVLSIGEQVQQVADHAVTFDWMAEGAIDVKRIMVIATHTHARYVPSIFQVGDDVRRRSLCNSHSIGNVTNPSIRLLRDANQYVCVVGQERPRTFAPFDRVTLHVYVSPQSQHSRI
jgi:hypothetical protein